MSGWEDEIVAAHNAAIARVVAMSSRQLLGYGPDLVRPGADEGGVDLDALDAGSEQ